MSSVSDISQRQEIQNLKDSYDESEKSSEARYKKQLANQEKRNAENIKNIREAYEDENKRTQDASRDIISEKEREHLKEIQNLQAASRRKMAQMKADDDERYDNSKKTYEGELKRTKDQDAKNQARLTKTFDNEMSQRDQEQVDMEQRYREGSLEALDQQKKRLQEKYNSDMDLLTKNYNDRIEQKDYDYDRLRKEKERNEDDMKSQKDAQGKNLETKYMGMVEKERQYHKENLDRMNEGFHTAIKQNQRRFQDTADNLRENYEKNFAQLKHNVDERTNKDVLQQKQINESLRSQNNFDRLKLKQDYETEKSHLMTEYKKSFDELERRRMAAIQDANRMKKDEVESLQYLNQKTMQKINDDNINRFEDYKNNVERSYIGQVDDANKMRELNQIHTENVKRRMADNYAQSLVAQDQFHEETAQSRQREHEKMMADQRQTMTRQQNNEVRVLKELNSKQNQQAQERLLDTIDKYQGQINTLKQDYEKKLKRQAELFKEQTERQNRYLQMDRDSEEAKHLAKINQLKETYEHQIETLKRKQASEAQATKKS